ncbi:MAG TPA: mandelate racemase/muconate lactonizing enzyme family protein [Bryobacteraceae bacterium]|nr:mandelate racemase/muconate lactonizing enzyme family protein [Bryobacteraceae bacterium]
MHHARDGHPAGIGRRRFTASALGWTAAAFAAEAATASGRIKITEIETHRITVEYHDWIAYQLNHYYGPSQRTVYVVHTDNGLTGLGEGGSSEPEEVVKRYIGTSPFDWMGDENSLPLGMAMYDLMGKAAGVPVYKLFGQKYRSWVPTGSWTVSTHPRRMAQAVQEYSRRGYTWLKFHLSPFENIFDQIEAIQAVAPEGFRVHLDFTMGGTDDYMPALLERLSSYRVVGCFEDPLNENDLPGYVELRKRSRLPIVSHHSPLGATQEVVMRVADVYMLGHARIGSVVQRAGLFAGANIPFMIQNVGGDITRAMTTHMQSAFPTASFHFFCDAETWKTDVVMERLEPVNGFVRVPESPGLGVTLDRAALKRAEELRLPEQPRWIIRSRFKNGSQMYHLADPKQSLFMVRPDTRRLIPMSYASPISTDYWDDDGTPAYKEMFARLEREGMVLERR